jgi:plastocyanin
MNHATLFRSPLGFWAVLLLTLMSFGSANAATHTIMFGNDFQYTPSQLSVQVGDVITWEGNFSAHPLQFDEVPAGATMPQNVTSGTTFSYTVEVAGSYAYHCMFHGSAGGGGMAGAFTAGTASVEERIDVSLMSISPNPVQVDRQFNLYVGFDASTIESMILTDVDGKHTTISAPSYSVKDSVLTIGLDPVFTAPGMYMLTIKTQDNSYTRKLMIRR